MAKDLYTMVDDLPQPDPASARPQQAPVKTKNGENVEERENEGRKGRMEFGTEMNEKGRKGRRMEKRENGLEPAQALVRGTTGFPWGIPMGQELAQQGTGQG